MAENLTAKSPDKFDATPFAAMPRAPRRLPEPRGTIANLPQAPSDQDDMDDLWDNVPV